jgi:hypothetical protein
MQLRVIRECSLSIYGTEIDFHRQVSGLAVTVLGDGRTIAGYASKFRVKHTEAAQKNRSPKALLIRRPQSLLSI